MNNNELVLSNEQEIIDLIEGFAFYGTGGGGLPKNGYDSLMSEINQGKSIVLTNKDSLPDTAITACPFLMGSIAPHTDEVIKEMDGFGFTNTINKEKDRMIKAILELEEYTDQKIDAIIPIELAGANTSAAIAAASSLGKMVVNGDYSGRAIPEIQQTTPYLNNKNILPITSVDEWDNVCVIKNAINYRVSERLGKLISAGAYGLAGQAGFLLSGQETKEIIIPNTMTESYELGKLIRESYDSNQDPIAATLKKLGGWLLFSGEITSKDDEDKLGYYWGTHSINGIDEHKNKIAKIWFKNENHILWIDNKPVVTSPDLIVMVDSKTGKAIPNPLSTEGQHVCVLGFPARPAFRSKKGIDILGPRYFNFDIDYTPIEVFTEK